MKTLVLARTRIAYDSHCRTIVLQRSLRGVSKATRSYRHWEENVLAIRLLAILIELEHAENSIFLRGQDFVSAIAQIVQFCLCGEEI